MAGTREAGRRLLFCKELWDATWSLCVIKCWIFLWTTYETWFLVLKGQGLTGGTLMIIASSLP